MVQKTIDLKNIFRDLDNHVVRWIVALAMAANDLSLNVKFMRHYNNNAESFYFFRLSFAHLKEIAVVINDAEKNEQIRSFLKNLDSDTKGLYQNIVKTLVPYIDGSISKDVLGSTRNECFHYPDIEGMEESFKELPKIINALDRKEVRFDDTLILNRRYIFADWVVGHMMNARLSSEKINNISYIVMDIIGFVDHVLEYLHRSGLE